MSSTDAAGSMISSARDLSTFIGALLEGELVAPPLLEQMLEPSDKGVLLGVAGWGLGMMALPLPKACGGRMLHGIGGGIYCYTGLVFSTRDGQRRAVISFNTASNDPTSETQKLIGIARLVFCGGPAEPTPMPSPRHL